MAPWLAVSSVQPLGTLVLNPLALNTPVPDTEPGAGDVLELGVTVGTGAPHALTVAAHAQVTRARLTEGGKVTPRG